MWSRRVTTVSMLKRWWQVMSLAVTAPIMSTLVVMLVLFLFLVFLSMLVLVFIVRRIG